MSAMVQKTPSQSLLKIISEEKEKDFLEEMLDF